MGPGSSFVARPGVGESGPDPNQKAGLRPGPDRQTTPPDVGPVGGRLVRFAHQWEQITGDKWVLSVVRNGLAILPNSFVPLSDRPVINSAPKCPRKRQVMDEQIQSLLQKRAIELVDQPSTSPGFYSRLFLVLKKNGKWRPVLNLKALNTHLESPHFKMETSRQILAAVRPHMWATSIDLQDAYLHVAIQSHSRRYLRFWDGQRVYQFRVLPFGLTTAPLVFTKVVAAVGEFLHTRGVHLHLYLDDSLVLHTQKQQLQAHTSLVVNTFERLGFLINQDKSDLIPAQEFTFLGCRLNTRLGVVHPTEEKRVKAKGIVVGLQQATTRTPRQLFQVLGFLNSLADVVPMGRLHTRSLQVFVLSHWKPVTQDWDQPLTLSPSVKADMLWWASEDNVLKGVPLAPPSPIATMYTDASSVGWGAVFQTHSAAGEWDPQQAREHINILEMRAVLLALIALAEYLRHKDIVLASDNSTVVAYLRNQGGTRSNTLLSLTRQIYARTLELNLQLTVRHVPGKLNVLADTLSRAKKPLETEWTLDPQVFRAVANVWGRPHVDLFATSLNAQLETFVSPVPDPAAWAVDAMSLDWSGLDLYAFPPFNMVGKVLGKLSSHRNCLLTLIAPRWPRQPWFPELLDALIDRPRELPADRPNLLTQPRSSVCHPRLTILHLHAWRLSGGGSCPGDSRARWRNASLAQSGTQQLDCTNLTGTSSVVGVSGGRLIHSVPLFQK